MAKVLVIGAGLFGCNISSKLAEDKNFTIDLVEKNNDIMQLASKNNHNRVHLGYHYLRSKETAQQSIEGLLSFLFNFGQAVITQFPNYYAIAQNGSKTTVENFISFCEDVRINYEEEFPDKNLMDKSKLEACFRVPEPVFDYEILKKAVIDKLVTQKNIRLSLNTACHGLEIKKGRFLARLNKQFKEYDAVVNASYANFNQVNSFLGIPPARIFYQDVLVPYFLYPSSKFGLTVMDGEFCSVMPKGIKDNEFLLYHVKYSIMNSLLGKTNKILTTPLSNDAIERVYRESAEFFPFLQETKHINYWRTIRAVHKNPDDARISEIFTYPEIDNYYAVLSGKITTCIKVALEIKKRLLHSMNEDKVTQPFTPNLPSSVPVEI